MVGLIFFAFVLLVFACLVLPFVVIGLAISHDKQAEPGKEMLKSAGYLAAMVLSLFLGVPLMVAMLHVVGWLL